MWRRRKSIERTDEIPTPDPGLHQLLDLRPWNVTERARFDNDALRDAIRRNPTAARATYDFGVSGRRYPLSRAVALGASLDVVKLLRKANPKAIEDRGVYGTRGYGGTALHAACAHMAPIDVVRYLVKKYPAALDQTTRYGYYPIHMACENGASVETIRFLAEMNPAALEKTNILGNTPLEIARNKERERDVLAVLTVSPTVGTESFQQTTTRFISKQRMPKFEGFLPPKRRSFDGRSGGKNSRQSTVSHETQQTNQTHQTDDS